MMMDVCLLILCSAMGKQYNQMSGFSTPELFALAERAQTVLEKSVHIISSSSNHRCVDLHTQNIHTFTNHIHTHWFPVASPVPLVFEMREDLRESHPRSARKRTVWAINVNQRNDWTQNNSAELHFHAMVLFSFVRTITVNWRYHISIPHICNEWRWIYILKVFCLRHTVCWVTFLYLFFTIVRYTTYYHISNQFRQL